LHGGVTVADSAKIFLDVLKNKGTAAQSAVVKANAAVALRCGSPWLSTEESTALAAESLESGKAFQSFEKLISI
jgi:anthranilate phosphoribosyltransferase